MIVQAIKTIRNIDANTKRIELFSEKFKSGKPLALLGIHFENYDIKFITSWDDVLDKSKPFKINGGLINDELIGTTTLVRGMAIQCGNENVIYIVMDPVFLK